MSNAVDSLLDILSLEKLEENLFRGRSPQAMWQRVFGGQVIAQALMAATQTVAKDRRIHSLHGYFMRLGDATVPIHYEVERIRDGGSFNTRRVVAIQKEKAIFSMSASYQIVEEGMSHQIEMPDIPMPEDLMSESEFKEKHLNDVPDVLRLFWKKERPLELRPVDTRHFLTRDKLPPYQNVWVKAASALPEDPHIHQSVLAYASDMTLLDTSLFSHGRQFYNPDLQVASLDHSMWFHRSFKADEWLLYTQDSPVTSGARGFTRGSLYTRDGTLVASTAQEGLIRLRGKKAN
ncbi:acyl-CoA thioesterase II [Flexibacterium corallicola]|uniref:acyl-CoA thioesterase II n=1 Tax=Flexibacterium corallicola TaxID=3037259 RepID=UPI00286F717F|nr:acyl-CoA thioesterase II [Pseudovibrio sp. M1P-2-3]